MTSKETRAVEAAIKARGVEWDIDPTLDPMRDLVDLLGHPERAYAVVHITGTNGKSTTTRMIDALLRERGLRVGRYTSPHLHSMRERIAIDGEPISEERFVEAYEDVLPYVRMVDEKRDAPVSFFEMLTVMAFAAFADAPVDVAVLEVGMGGEWDATNVADGAVAVVTPIGLDHMSYLGDTIEQIAAEKAGIIKPGSVVVMAQQPVEAAEVLMTRAAERGAAVAREGLEFGVLNREVAVGGQRLRLQGLHAVYDDVFLPLFGAHQAGNAACALAAVEAFASPHDAGWMRDTSEQDVGSDADAGGSGGRWGEAGQAAERSSDGLDPELVRAAFAKTASPGRLEVVRSGPTVLVDAAHNPAGMAAIVAAVTEEFGFTRLIGVVAAMVDKDVMGLLAELEPLLTEVIVTRNSSPRSMPVAELAELAEDIFGEDRVRTAARMDDAIDSAIALADDAGENAAAGVLITGSVVTAADARLLMRAET